MMSSPGCLKSERIPQLLDAATILLPEEERTHGGYLSLLVSSLCAVLRAMDSPAQNGSLIQIHGLLETVRKPLIDPRHCESCQDTSDILDAVIPKLGYVDAPAAIHALGMMIKILLDTISDEQLVDDCISGLEDIVFPDEEEQAETLH